MTSGTAAIAEADRQSQHHLRDLQRQIAAMKIEIQGRQLELENYAQAGAQANADAVCGREGICEQIAKTKLEMDSAIKEKEACDRRVAELQAAVAHMAVIRTQLQRELLHLEPDMEEADVLYSEARDDGCSDGEQMHTGEVEGKREGEGEGEGEGGGMESDLKRLGKRASWERETETEMERVRVRIMRERKMGRGRGRGRGRGGGSKERRRERERERERKMGRSR